MQTDNQEEILVNLLIPKEEAKEILYQAYLQGYSPEKWCAQTITRRLQIEEPSPAPAPVDPAAFAIDTLNEPADISILGSIFQH